jgi:hypothetical protein
MSAPSYKVTPENYSVIIQTITERIHSALTGGAVVVRLEREKRSKDQNAKMWPMLTDLSKQKEYAGKMRPPVQWKDICTACYEEQEIVPGVNGGFIALGAKTSSYNKKQFSELIECIYWIGQEYDIKWSEKALATYEHYGEARNGED